MNITAANSDMSHPGETPETTPATAGDTREIIAKRIADWQQLLIDLSKRNRMINYRETKRTSLRLLEPGFAELYRRVALKEEPLMFQRPLDKESDFRAFAMLALLETLDSPLNVHLGDIKAQGSILERQKTLRNLRAKAKLARDEQGINILYLTFGFLEWTDQQGPEAPTVKSPLIMVPVNLRQEALGAPFILERREDEIVLNPTLVYKFQVEYGLALPAFDPDKTDLLAYMTAMEQLADTRGWKVLRETSLGLVSFAKFTMYHDLAYNRERIMESPVIRAMCGDESALTPLPEKFDQYDFDSVAPQNRWQVLNADSSQQEAVALAKLGISFVMQGPPGTGKSQTITNIIAEIIACGGKVLFVSEKAAALQVVYRRLTEAGLADFCLPLHSHKASKRYVLEALAENLHLPHNRVKESVLQELNDLFYYRNELNAYAWELHGKIQPLGLSIYEAYGFLAKYKEVEEIPFTLENPGEITNEVFHSMLYGVADLQESIKRLGGRLSKSPWYNTKLTAVNHSLKTHIVNATQGLEQRLDNIRRLLLEAQDEYSASLPLTWHSAEILRTLYAAVESTPEFPCHWLERGLRQQLLTQARQLKTEREEYLKQLDKCLYYFKPEILDMDLAKWLGDLKNELYKLGSLQVGIDRFDTGKALTQVLSINKQTATLLKNLEQIFNDYIKVSEALAMSSGGTLDEIQLVCEVIATMLEAPPLKDHWFDKNLNIRAGMLENAIARRGKIAALTSELLARWEPEIFRFNHRLMLKRFKGEYNGVFKNFNKDYREDCKTLRTMWRDAGKKLSDDTMIELLQALNKLDEDKDNLNKQVSELSQAFGHDVCAGPDDFDKLRTAVRSAQKLQSLYKGEVPEAIIRLVSERANFAPAYELLGKLSKTLAPAYIVEARRQVTEFFGLEAAQSHVREEIFPKLENLLYQTSNTIQLIRDIAGISLRQISAGDVENLVKEAYQVQQTRKTLTAADDKLTAAFGNFYHGPDTDWDEVLAKLDSIGALYDMLATYDFNVAFTQSFCDNPEVRAEIREAARRLTQALDETLPVYTIFKGLFIGGHDMDDEELTDVIKHFQICTGDLSLLDSMMQYKSARRGLALQGLEEFAHGVEALDGAVDMYIAFQKSFYRQWLEAVVVYQRRIMNFNRHEHDIIVQRFARLDKKQLEIAKYRIRDRVIAGLPFRQGYVEANDELRILQRELDKKQRLMPVRKLFDSIPNLVLALKPCLLMSPLSVSYFLEADSFEFDLVIFDEASQIFPQDAVGSIYRAKQVIIAGDVYQLPPTNFFAAATSNNGEFDIDDEDADYDNVYESILENAAYYLPCQTLSWHYRSRDERLIAFSNREIYRNKLVTFPSTMEKPAHSGVELVYVEDGVYERGERSCNVREAQMCVELIREHLERHPQRSLGIIAFSEKQQRAILREVLQFREDHPEFEDFFAEDRDEEFFIKNLENVQGDERDTIIFSIGYGRDTKGRLHMNFGPLNRPGGERRLNVAVTRAKRNIKLVSSITANDIDLDRTEALGVRLLRNYLDFAQNGVAALRAPVQANYNVPTDEFADALAQWLTEKGFNVKTRLGCSAYKIDIAVQHPDDPERYVAAIECDGLAYMAAKTARDRDHLRRTVLVGMGWELYRVWSAEWFTNMDAEQARLLAFINKAIKKAGYPAETPEENTVTEAMVMTPSEEAAILEPVPTEPPAPEAAPESAPPTDTTDAAFEELLDADQAETPPDNTPSLKDLMPQAEPEIEPTDAAEPAQIGVAAELEEDLLIASDEITLEAMPDVIEAENLEDVPEIVLEAAQMVSQDDLPMPAEDLRDMEEAASAFETYGDADAGLYEVDELLSELASTPETPIGALAGAHGLPMAAAAAMSGSDNGLNSTMSMFKRKADEIPAPETPPEDLMQTETEEAPTVPEDIAESALDAALPDEAETPQAIEEALSETPEPEATPMPAADFGAEPAETEITTPEPETMPMPAVDFGAKPAEMETATPETLPETPETEAAPMPAADFGAESAETEIATPESLTTESGDSMSDEDEMLRAVEETTPEEIILPEQEPPQIVEELAVQENVVETPVLESISTTASDFYGATAEEPTSAALETPPTEMETTSAEAESTPEETPAAYFARIMGMEAITPEMTAEAETAPVEAEFTSTENIQPEAETTPVEAEFTPVETAQPEAETAPVEAELMLVETTQTEAETTPVEAEFTPMETTPAEIETAPVEAEFTSTETIQPEAETAPVETELTSVETAQPEAETAPVVAELTPVETAQTEAETAPVVEELTPMKTAQPEAKTAPVVEELTPVETTPAEIETTPVEAEFTPVETAQTEAETASVSGDKPQANEDFALALAEIAPEAVVDADEDTPEECMAVEPVIAPPAPAVPEVATVTPYAPPAEPPPAPETVEQSTVTDNAVAPKEQAAPQIAAVALEAAVDAADAAPVAAHEPFGRHEEPEVYKPEDFIEMTPTELPKIDPNNPYGFPYYVEADWSRASLSPRGDRQTHLGEQLLYVIGIEQPIHKELLCKRMVGAFHNQKVTSLVRKSVSAALEEAIADKITVDENDFVTLKHHGAVTVRAPQDPLERRAPEQIAPMEIAAAVPYIIQRTFGLDRPTLVNEVSKVFGYAKRNAKLTQAIETAIDRLIAGGVIKIVDNKKILLVK